MATFFLVPSQVLGQEQRSLFDNMIQYIFPTGRKAYGYGSGVPPDIRVIIAMIVRVVIMVLIVVFFALIVFGGYTWMMARGEEDRVEKGKNILRHGTIGITIIIAAYAITRFILTAAVCSTNEFSQWCLFFAGIT